ncbi:sulfatase [Armatimonas sp.]|uniref:sulfatase family protein n=1 Tax=Armatimonas sp. TaxID=1872638 RepID=UPI003750D10C
MPQPNVVLLAIDTLRPDHLGCHAYGKNTSPNMDALAAESVVFEQAIAAGIPTMPSFTTMLTGLHPFRHGIVAHIGEKQRVAARVQTLPQLAQKAGWTTIGIDNLVIQGGGKGSWFARGFDHYSGFLYAPFTNQSEQLIERAIQFVDEQDKATPFFLYCHLWDPHTPYGPPPPFDTMHYEPGSAEHELAEVIALAPDYYKAFLGEMKCEHPDDYAAYVALYDGEISYVDVQVGRLIAHLKQANLWDNTLFVLMSDHGEAFGAGEIHFDHHGLYDAVTRVALMARVPGTLPSRTQALVSTEDLLPTLAALCGWELPTSYALTGQSFASALSGEEFVGRERVFCIESSRQASMAIRTRKWKLIQPIMEDARGKPLPHLHGTPRDPALLLFDLENDPHEKYNLAKTHPEVREALRVELLAWHANEIALRGGHDPIKENGLSLSYEVFMSRLRARHQK